MTSIVGELEAWVSRSRQQLEEHGVVIEERFPTADSKFSWKATIGLEHGEFLVSYTVWEQTSYQTMLLVFNKSTLETIVNEDTTPEEPSIVAEHLDRVVENLLGAHYWEAKPPT